MTWRIFLIIFLSEFILGQVISQDGITLEDCNMVMAYSRDLLRIRIVNLYKDYQLLNTEDTIKNINALLGVHLA